MAKLMHNQEKTETKHVQTEKMEEVSLKGTFVSVMLLGGFLALTWLLVFILFIVRN